MKIGKLFASGLVALSLFSFGGSISHASSADLIMDVVNIGVATSTGNLQHRSMLPSRWSIGYAATSNSFGAQAISMALSFIPINGSGVFMNFSDVHDGLVPNREVIGERNQSFEIPVADFLGKI